MVKISHLIILVFIFLNGRIVYGQKGDANNNVMEKEVFKTKSDTYMSLNPNHLNSLEVNYHTLKKYYSNIAPDYIEVGDIFLQDLYQNPLELDVNSLRFIVEEKDSTIQLNVPISPESTQKLFTLDENKYIKAFGGNDFLEAKINSYKKLKFSESKQNYSKKYYQLWDWKSLNHPPVRNLKYPLDFYDKKRTKIDYDTIQSPFFNADLHHIIDKNTQSHLTFENKLKILRNGSSYQKKLELIDNAKSSICISVMSYYKDSSSLIMTQKLINKANEGVKVYLIVEKVWTKLLMKKGMRPFKNSKVVLIYADDLLHFKDHQAALFHNKIWVFDDRVAIIGGQNIIDSNNISSGYNHQSCDTDLLIEGAAVTDIAKSFITLLKDYNFEKKSSAQQIAYIQDFQERMNQRYDLEMANKLRGSAIYKEKLEDKNTRLKGVCRYVIQGPQNDRFAISKAYIYYFKNAQYLIDITTGKIKIDLKNKQNINNYEGWWLKVWNELFLSAKQGTNINLINNGVDGGYGELSNYLKRKALTNYQNKFIANYYPQIAQKLDIKAAKRNYSSLYYLQQKEHINAWMYFQYIHSKTFMIDRFVVSVGSYNLDNWSSDKSQEAVLICQDKELAKAFEYQFTLDRVNSTPVSHRKK